MLSGGVVAWGDADSGGDCSWLSAELQDVQVLSTVGWSMEFLGGFWINQGNSSMISKGVDLQYPNFLKSIAIATLDTGLPPWE